MLKGFVLPEILPESIDFIRNQNCPLDQDIAYYNAYVDKLMEFLYSMTWPKWKRRAAAISAIFMVAAIATIIYFCSTTYLLMAGQSNRKRQCCF